MKYTMTNVLHFFVRTWQLVMAARPTSRGPDRPGQPEPRPLTILQLEIMTRLYLLRPRRPTISRKDLAGARRITYAISILFLYDHDRLTCDCNHGVTSVSVTHKQVEEIEHPSQTILQRRAIGTNGIPFPKNRGTHKGHDVSLNR
jgi:hypothetical protein